MTEKFIIASNNQYKIKEIREILSGIKAEVLTPGDLGISFDVDETGSTFEENALLKARGLHRITGGYVMADDSGLSVKALDGAPGIFSARFAGEDASYRTKIEKIWEMLDECPDKDRSASFVCAVAVVLPDGNDFTVRGECHGLIHSRLEGDNGFGYDPVFYMPEYGMTTASMSREMKNSISHRGAALREMVKQLKLTTNLFNDVDGYGMK